MTIFSDEEVDVGLRRLGTFDEARKFLRQRLMEELVSTAGPGLSNGAARHIEGRRSFASELIEALGLNDVGGDGGRTDSGLVRRRRGIEPGRSGGPARRVGPTRDDD